MGKLKAFVKIEICLTCGGCISICPKDAILMISGKAVVNKDLCTSCSICVKTCPIAAICWEGKKDEL